MARAHHVEGFGDAGLGEAARDAELDDGIVDEAAMAVGERFLEHREEELLEIVEGGGVAGKGREPAGDEAVHVEIERGAEQAGLVAEGIVDAAGDEAGGLFEIGNGDVAIAALPEQVHGGGDNGIPIEGACSSHGAG